MLCFVFSFNYNGFSPKAYLSSLLYFLFPLCLVFCQADITAPWSPIWMEAFPQHGKHNLTEPSALSRTHIPEASTVHQTKAVGHLDVNHSLRFLQYQTHWCCGRLDWSSRRKSSRCDRMKGWLALHRGSGLHPHLGMMGCCMSLCLRPHRLFLQNRELAKILDCCFVGIWFFFYPQKEVNFTVNSSCTSWAAWGYICVLYMKNERPGKS